MKSERAKDDETSPRFLSSRSASKASYFPLSSPCLAGFEPAYQELRCYLTAYTGEQGKKDGEVSIVMPSLGCTCVYMCEAVWFFWSHDLSSWPTADGYRQGCIQHLKLERETLFDQHYLLGKRLFNLHKPDDRLILLQSSSLFFREIQHRPPNPSIGVPILFV